MLVLNICANNDNGAQLFDPYATRLTNDEYVQHSADLNGLLLAHASNINKLVISAEFEPDFSYQDRNLNECHSIQLNRLADINFTYLEQLKELVFDIILDEEIPTMELRVLQNFIARFPNKEKITKLTLNLINVEDLSKHNLGFALCILSFPNIEQLTLQSNYISKMQENLAFVSNYWSIPAKDWNKYIINALQLNQETLQVLSIPVASKMRELTIDFRGSGFEHGALKVILSNLPNLKRFEFQNEADYEADMDRIKRIASEIAPILTKNNLTELNLVLGGDPINEDLDVLYKALLKNKSLESLGLGLIRRNLDQKVEEFIAQALKYIKFNTTIKNTQLIYNGTKINLDKFQELKPLLLNFYPNESYDNVEKFLNSELRNTEYLRLESKLFSPVTKPIPLIEKAWGGRMLIFYDALINQIIIGNISNIKNTNMFFKATNILIARFIDKLYLKSTLKVCSYLTFDETKRFTRALISKNSIFFNKQQLSAAIPEINNFTDSDLDEIENIYKLHTT